MIENPAIFIRVARNWKKNKWNVWVHYPDGKAEAYQSLKALKQLTGKNLRRACQRSKDWIILGYTFA